MNQKTKKSLLVFRAAAVLAGLLVFPLAELICCVFGWGSVPVDQDAFVGFSAIRPLFVKSPDAVSMEISAARRGFFEHDSFLISKPDHEFRIFVFGGSTVQGCPWSTATSFTEFLKLTLNQISPDRSWKVVNCGGISYASFRIVPLMQECRSYQPDLFIFCEGHNEFLEQISYGPAQQNHPALVFSYGILNRFRSFRVLDGLIHGGSRSRFNITDRPILPAEVHAVLDDSGGLKQYHRDDQHAAAVRQHFQSNLERMVTLCHDAQIPLLFIQPPGRLADCPPFKSDFSEHLDEPTRTSIRNSLQAASLLIATDPVAAVEQLRQITDLDPRFAYSWYQLGRACQTAGLHDEAVDAFERARDEDVCPLRMTSALEETMQQVATNTSTSILNARQLLEHDLPDRIPGDQLLVDHVHPSFAGHQKIALAIVDWMTQQAILPDNIIPPANAGFTSDTITLHRMEILQATMQERFSDHIQKLDSLYFLKAQRRLKDQQAWTEGRADSVPMGEADSSTLREPSIKAHDITVQQP
jgi:hypothetical protein